MRHADAGHDIAIECAREQGLKLPMIWGIKKGRAERLPFSFLVFHRGNKCIV